MSRRRGRGDDRGPGLFDLPLHQDPGAPAPIDPEADELDDALAGESLFDDPLEDREPDPLADEPSTPSALSLFPELDEELERAPEPGTEDAEPAATSPLRAPVRDFEPVTPAEDRPLGPRPVPDLEDDAAGDAADTAEDETAEPGAPRPAALGSRLMAGLLDLVALGVVAGVLWWGSRWLGVDPGTGGLPALALFLLLFSAIYTIIPLAFWGATPGMSRTGLIARTAAGEPLTFGQTARRWLGGLLTAALAGLPLLLALGEGGSLTDRLSGSETFETI